MISAEKLLEISSITGDQLVNFNRVVENGKSLDYGCVEIDILKLKEHKDSSKVSLLELEKEFFYPAE